MTKAIMITDAGAVTAEPIQVHDAINMTLAFINGMVAQTAATMDEGEKETLFNALNESYSRSLEICFPEMELRPDVTVEAIMEVEDKILAEKAKDCEPIDFKAMKESKCRANLKKGCQDHKR